MGTHRRASSQRALRRVSLPTTERETLLPCPACDGIGKRLIERAGGSYKMIACRWCDANGFVDHTIFAVFRRWLRIANRNRLADTCDLKH